jgi:hypothetical protein
MARDTTRIVSFVRVTRSRIRKTKKHNLHHNLMFRVKRIKKMILVKGRISSKGEETCRGKIAPQII